MLKRNLSLFVKVANIETFVVVIPDDVATFVEKGQIVRDVLRKLLLLQGLNQLIQRLAIGCMHVFARKSKHQQTIRLKSCTTTITTTYIWTFSNKATTTTIFVIIQTNQIEISVRLQRNENGNTQPQESGGTHTHTPQQQKHEWGHIHK